MSMMQTRLDSRVSESDRTTQQHSHSHSTQVLLSNYVNRNNITNDILSVHTYTDDYIRTIIQVFDAFKGNFELKRMVEDTRIVFDNYV